jgi:hypothetical protein
MNESSIWMTPESFVEQFWNNPQLLQALIRVLIDDNDTRVAEIYTRVRDQEPVTLDEMVSVRVEWTSNFLHGVANFREYVSALRSDSVEFVRASSPLIDKKNRLVLDVTGGHESLATWLFRAYEGWEAAPTHECAPEYVLRGYGYYCSSVSDGYYFVGRTLFDKNVLNEDDAYLLDDSIIIVESVADFRRKKSRFGYK